MSLRTCIVRGMYLSCKQTHVFMFHIREHCGYAFMRVRVSCGGRRYLCLCVILCMQIHVFFCHIMYADQRICMPGNTVDMHLCACVLVSVLHVLARVDMFVHTGGRLRDANPPAAVQTNGVFSYANVSKFLYVVAL